MPGGVKLGRGKVAQALRRSGGVVAEAARVLGVDRYTVYRYIQKYKSLQRLRADLRESFVDLAESKLIEAVKAGEPWAIKLALRTLGASRGYTERVEHVGLGGGPIQVEQVTDPADLARLYELAAARYRRLSQPQVEPAALLPAPREAEDGDGPDPGGA